MLNNAREQTVRLSLRAEDNSIIAFRDITIIKTYISEDRVDVNSIAFD
ncbi:MAG: hypothetical protein LBF15_00435 [Candidatus Peribacteria bacterium]|nr:hypothetical protein [Candidatus Peribacteria bacterium]